MSGRDQTISVLRQLLQRVQARAASMRPPPAAPSSTSVPAPPRAPSFDLAPAPAPVPAFESAAAPPTPAPAATAPPLAPEAEFLEELSFSSPPPPPQVPAPLPPTSGTVKAATPVGRDELEFGDDLFAEPRPPAPPAFDADAGQPLELIEVGPVEPEQALDAEERAPISSRRPRAPEPLDDAPTDTDLSAGLSFDREAPLITPPPESGRQELVPIVEVPTSPMPQIDAPTDDLELAIPVSAAPPPPFAPASRSSVPSVPSVEQLGGTIDLATGDSDVPLELAAPKPTPSQLPSGEMEAVLPPAVGGGTYTPELAPPPEVADDLARHDLSVGLSTPPSRIEHTQPGPPVALRPAAPPSVAPPAPAPATTPPPAPVPAAADVRLLPDPAPAAPPLPEVGPAPAPVAVEIAASVTHRRAAAAADVVAFVGEARRFAPETFGELLDASLALGD